jgi:hypothetical protein
MSLLPLPLELAQPIHLSGALDDMFRAGLGTGRYNPKTQMNFDSNMCDTSSDSTAESNTTDNTGLIVLDNQTDFALADDIGNDYDNSGGWQTDSSSTAESNTTDNTGLIVVDSQGDAAALDDIGNDYSNG